MRVTDELRQRGLDIHTTKFYTLQSSIFPEHSHRTELSL